VETEFKYLHKIDLKRNISLLKYFGGVEMKKTLLATGMMLALGTTGSANAAFTALADGDYTVTITGGCFDFGNCVANSTGALADNNTTEASITTTSAIGVLPPGTYGSGIAGDGIMGVIGVTKTGDSLSVNSFSQDSFLNTSGGTFYLDALGAGTSGMAGTIDATGNMTFDPTGRMGMAAGFASTLGQSAWNLDNASDGGGTGLYDVLGTGTDSNRKKGLTPGFTLTGSILQDAGVGTWTGTLVTAGNIGTQWGSFDLTQYAEVWNVEIQAVPVPAAAWLFGSGLVGLAGVARRRKQRN